MNLSNKRRTKAATASAVVLAIMLTMSACGSNAKDPSADNTQGNIPTVAPTDNLPEETGIAEPETPIDNGTNSENNGEEVPTSNPISAEGIYTGQIDSNSIEITTSAGADSYRITEELTAVIEALPSDSKVKFEYTSKVDESDSSIKLLYLTKIEEIK
ncbi:hypothetical protein [Paenibacillus sp. L3-i20]|uniref:hypothetical protein n=1 Tax=Paenibacillus sp. L3-i20 TaxID=2905833 RepID=UPI001EE00A4E|nr:hypothetical protein [Paenibacillus sp. L3-i20]GKU76001.1 hypothetical protein L3i20_v203980 [Paenibacillus sp. L3-i20]